MTTRFARLLLGALLATLLLARATVVAPIAQASSCPGAYTAPSAANIGAARSATLCLINAERSARGLAPLAAQPLLENPATEYSQAMVQGRFFDHVSPGGQDLLQRLAGYLLQGRGSSVAENLAWGDGEYAAPATIVGQWMRSDVHRANVLGASFREIGVGIANGSPFGSNPAGSATYTVAFGARLLGGLLPGTRSDPGAPDASPTAGASASPTTSSTPADGLSAATKRRIKASCKRQARRIKSRSARRKRISRCVSARMR